MKVRNGFISNSSSSSFIINNIKEVLTKEQFVERLQQSNEFIPALCHGRDLWEGEDIFFFGERMEYEIRKNPKRFLDNADIQGIYPSATLEPVYYDSGEAIRYNNSQDYFTNTNGIKDDSIKDRIKWVDYNATEYASQFVINYMLYPSERDAYYNYDEQTTTVEAYFNTYATSDYIGDDEVYLVRGEYMQESVDDFYPVEYIKISKEEYEKIKDQLAEDIKVYGKFRILTRSESNDPIDFVFDLHNFLGYFSEVSDVSYLFNSREEEDDI